MTRLEEENEEVLELVEMLIGRDFRTEERLREEIRELRKENERLR